MELNSVTVNGNTKLNRIEKVLSHIHNNLEKPLSVEGIAEQSCWSRWQLQRVFTSETGMNVAQYIRSIRLSKAAELLISTPSKQLDIALDCGFDSAISFSRAFKQMFGCSPSQYRKTGKRTGLTLPINVKDLPPPPPELSRMLLQIRVESLEAFEVYGMSTMVKGLFSGEPDFLKKVPGLWKEISDVIRPVLIPNDTPLKPTGVLVTSDSASNNFQFPYWATVNPNKLTNTLNLKALKVPAQQYAVIPFKGEAEYLQCMIDWFLTHWLPQSDYSGIYGYELEFYPEDADENSLVLDMEYWIPIELQD